jgi:hypothetical protein
MKIDDLLKPRKQTKKAPRYNWAGSGVQPILRPDGLKTSRSPYLYYGIPTAVVQSGTGEDTVGAGAGITGVSESQPDILNAGKTKDK